MSKLNHRKHLLSAISFAVILISSCISAAAPTITEQRAKCNDYTPLKRPLFGDLHVHTSYSFDSYVSSQRPAADN